MAARARSSIKWLACLAITMCLTAGGCFAHRCQHNADLPRELAKVPLPPYVIEPPDILLIDTLRVIPKPPYFIQPLDVLSIQASGVIETQPILGLYTVEPDGTVDLGLKYGSVKVAGMKIEEAKQAIVKYLQEGGYKNADASVNLAQSRAMQQVRGEHLVRPDGTISLGTYGSIPVVGLTLEEARLAIETFLSQFIVEPEVSVDVGVYNSKVYYVVADGGGYGEQVYPFPITGNETVLDAVAKINGLPAVASKRRIWLARPDPECHTRCNCFAVDWNAVVRCGDTRTNYQVLPGDRVYIQAEPLITLDSALARIISPIERVFGVTLLGNATIRAVGGQNGGTGTGTGGF
jgi:polysaccharide export outer membrane protein